MKKRKDLLFRLLFATVLTGAFLFTSCSVENDSDPARTSVEASVDASEAAIRPGTYESTTKLSSLSEIEFSDDLTTAVVGPSPQQYDSLFNAFFVRFEGSEVVIGVLRFQIVNETTIRYLRLEEWAPVLYEIPAGTEYVLKEL